MSFRVIEKRDDDSTLAILDNVPLKITQSEATFNNTSINISWKPNQNQRDIYLTNNEKDKRSLIIKPNQKDTKSNNSPDNKTNNINKNKNTLQSEQVVSKPNTLPTNQSPRKANTQQNLIDQIATQTEQKVIKPNKTQNEQKVIKPTATQNEQKVISPTKTQTETTVRKPNISPTNQSPRKQNSTQETSDSSTSQAEKTVVSPNAPQTNQSPQKVKQSNLNKSVSGNAKAKKSNRRLQFYHSKLFKLPKLLPPLLPSQENKITLVLDLDETLVHSVFFYIPRCDFSFMTDPLHLISVCVRPGVKDFILKMGTLYELVLFTVGNNIYATRIIDFIDPQHMIKYRLFRDSCTFSRGNFVKDLSKLGRDLHRVIILDDSPASYMFQPYNALPISSWIGDPNDDELIRVQKFLVENHQVNEVYNILNDYRSKYKPTNHKKIITYR